MIGGELLSRRSTVWHRRSPHMLIFVNALKVVCAAARRWPSELPEITASGYALAGHNDQVMTQKLALGFASTVR